MKWNIVAFLSLFGAAMGTLSLFGLTEGIELYGWIIIALIAAVVIARTTNGRHFLHGLFSGAGMGITNCIVQASLFSLYAANNPAVSRMENLPGGFSPQIFLLISSPFIGAVYGLVIGGLCVAAGKFYKPN